MRQQSNAAIRRKARELLEQGLTRRQIARRLRRKETTVTSWLTGLGGEVRRPWTPDESRAVLTMRAARVKWKDICFALGRREEAIRAAMERRGIEIPRLAPRGRQPRPKAAPRPKAEPRPPKAVPRKREPKRFDPPLKPMTWAEWHAERERERAVAVPEPSPIHIPAVDDWEDRPLGSPTTNSPAR